MKGSFYGIMGKSVFLLLVAFTCTTISLWSWDKTSLLLWLLPSESRSLQLSPESNTKQVKPMGANMSSVVGMRDDKNVNNTGNQACDYANGKWISDKNWPLYSGLDCKQWLSPMWACRMTHRPNFAYEKLRWQPKDCKTQNFEPSKFLLRMQDKTLAFIGDSLGRQQFQSLMCMITGGKNSPDVQNVGKDYNLLKPRHAIRPNGWAYRFKTTNTTILYYWSASLTNLQPLVIPKTKKVVNYAMHLDRPPAFLHRYIEKFDVLVLNTGHHWNMEKIKANKWIIHVKGVPVPVLNTNSEIEDIKGAKNFTISSIIKWVDSYLPRNPRLKAFYRTISPSHFMKGHWNTGGSCDNTTPPIGKEVVQRSSTDFFAARAVKDTEVKLLDITALSEVRNDGHISRWRIRANMEGQDCLHWCLPGVPDTWNEILFSQL